MYIYYISVRYTQVNPENIHVNMSGNDFIASQSMIISPDVFLFDNINDKQMIIPVFSKNNIGDSTYARDPKVWKYSNSWYIVLGSQYLDENNDKQGQLLFYASQNSKDWFYKYCYRRIHIGDMWECPDIFHINQQ